MYNHICQPSIGSRDMRFHSNKKRSPLSKGFSEAIGAVRRLGKEILLVAVMICGVVVVAASIAYASSLPAKMLSVITAAIGSILGTAIVCLALPRLTQAGVDQRLRDLKLTLQREAQLEASIEKLHDAAEHLLEETRTVGREKNELALRIQRLETMRVNTDSVRAILRLALLEIDAVIKDFYYQELSKYPPGDLQRGELHEYVGVVETSFKAALGVDLRKVRLREDDENRIVISGLSSEFQGLSDLSEDWKLFEVRVKRWGGLFLPDTYEILPNDERVADLTIEQRSSLQKRINSGIDFVNLDAAIKRIAREVLATLLSPLQRELVFVEEDAQPGVQLIEFLEIHNRQLDLLKNDLETQRGRLLEGQGAARGPESLPQPSQAPKPRLDK